MATVMAMPAAATELLELTQTMTTDGGRKSPAPHKPLLILWATWRRALDADAPRLIPYEEAHRPMGQLLAAAHCRRPRPWYPFVRLANEAFWELDGPVALNDAGDVSSATQLAGVSGGFRSAYAECLVDPFVASAVTAAVSAYWLPNDSGARVNELARSLARTV